MTFLARSRRRHAIASLAAAATLLAACGSDSTDADDQPVAEADADTVAAVQETGPVDFEPGTQLTPFDPEAADPAVGSATPVVEGERFDGTAITIGGPTDQPTMYVFLAHWCPACNAEVPELLALDESGDLPDGLDVVAVSTAAAPDRDNFPPSQWLADFGWPWDAMADDEQATAMAVFGGSSFPFTVLADADGTVLARKAGAAPASEIAAWLDASLGA